MGYLTNSGISTINDLIYLCVVHVNTLTVWKDRHFIINLKNHIKMEKKQMLTGIFLIPTLHASIARNANEVVHAIIFQLGALNCEADNDAAVIICNGLLSKETKETLDKEIKCHGHIALFIEAEKETSFANNNTFHIPTNEEMVEHLNAQDYGKIS